MVTWLMRLTGMVARRGPLDLMVPGDAFLLNFWVTGGLEDMSAAIVQRVELDVS